MYRATLEEEVDCVTGEGPDGGVAAWFPGSFELKWGRAPWPQGPKAGHSRRKLAVFLSGFALDPTTMQRTEESA